MGLKGLDNEGKKPIIGSTWAATVNGNHKDVFRIFAFNGSDAQMELIERDGQKRHETHHIWPIANFVLQYGKELKLLSLPGEAMELNPKKVEIAKLVYLESKLGIGTDGKPTIGSIWDGSAAEGWAKDYFYQVTRHDPGSSNVALQKVLQDGSAIPRGDGAWNWE